MAVFRSAWLSRCPDRVFSYLTTDPADAVARFIEGDIDLAAIHSPMTSDERERAAKRCDGGPALHLPMTFRAITLPYNLPGVETLVLTGQAIAKIFTGAIKTWTDPEIVAANPGTTLPDLPVSPVLPAEDSVMTEDFTAYLRAVRPGVGGFPASSATRAGTDSAVIGTVTRTPGAIGYTAASVSRTAPLPSALIDSGEGPVGFAEESAMLAIDAAEFAETGNDLALDTRTLYRTWQPGGYPLVGVSYQVVCSKGYEESGLATVRSFLQTAAQIDRNEIAAAGYVPLPNYLRERILDVVDSLE